MWGMCVPKLEIASSVLILYSRGSPTWCPVAKVGPAVRLDLARQMF